MNDIKDLKWEIKDLNAEVAEYKAIIRAMEKMEKIQSRTLREKEGEVYDLKIHVRRQSEEIRGLRARQCDSCNLPWFSGDR